MIRRYKAIKGSQQGHGCCFDATVVDLTKPVMIGDEHHKEQYAVLCECFDMKDARQISMAMNAALAKEGAE